MSLSFSTTTSKKDVVPIYQEPVGETPPIVVYSEGVYAKLQVIVDYAPKEAGWFGVVEYDEDNEVFYIDDIVIPEQIVTAGSTDITPKALHRALFPFVKEGREGDCYYWGHSHVDMDTTPSPQDETTVREWLEQCPIFIRGIYNKHGKARVDVYYRDKGFAHTNVFNTPAELILPMEQEQGIVSHMKEVIKEHKVYTNINNTQKNKKVKTYSSTASNNTSKDNDYLYSDYYDEEGEFDMEAFMQDYNVKGI